MGHARTLLALADHELIVKVADETIRNAWSVRALEQKVKEANEALVKPPAGAESKIEPKGKTRPVWLKELEETLMDSLAAPVLIRYGRKRSQIIIDCASREEFERLYDRLKGS